MEGSLKVDIGQLYHLSNSLGVCANALDTNDQRPDPGQIGNGDLAASLDKFFTNWNYKRTDLVDKLKKLSQGIADAATSYQEQEKAIHDPIALLLGPSGPLLQGGGTNPQQTGNPQPAGQNGSTKPGDSSGALPNSARSWQDAKAAYDANYSTMRDSSNHRLYNDAWPTGDNRYQCVSWAWFRMRELGCKTPQVPANGGQLAGVLGGTTGTQPKLGAVMSAGNHVFIAEQITSANGHVTVRYSEMNSGTHADGSRAPDSYTDPTTGVKSFIPASADEFKSTNTITQSADGFWYYGKDKVTIFNPDYSGS